MKEKLIKITFYGRQRHKDKMNKKSQDKKDGKGDLNGSEWLRHLMDNSK